MRKVLLFMTLIMSLTFVSCEKDKSPVETDDSSSIVLAISNPMLVGELEALGKASDGKYGLPDCHDSKARKVQVVINGKTYLARIIEGILESGEIRLPAGQHSIESAAVLDKDGHAIYAGAMASSEIATQTGVVGFPISFETKAFDKKRVDIDVLCYEQSYYKEFGFNWFEFVQHEVKETCFYVNLCRDNFDEWHAEGSPYFGQEYDGKYFSGIIEVTISGNGWSQSASNQEWFGSGAPLCVPYLDINGVEDIYTFEIWLYLPDGSKTLVHSGTYTDETVLDFTGRDGVYDMRIACEPTNEPCVCDCDIPVDVISDSREKVEVCHKVQIGNNWKTVTLSVPASAVDAHLAHGDVLGSCE